MSMLDKRVISLLVADPLEAGSIEKIKKLDSRTNNSFKDRILSNPSKYFEHDQRLLDYNEIFKPTIIDKNGESAQLLKRFSDIRKSDFFIFFFFKLFEFIKL